MEEIILMLFLEYLLFEVRVQGSTCESYFSLMKGWHGEARDGLSASLEWPFRCRVDIKKARGARRNFPSVFAEREAHSVIYFQKIVDRMRIGSSSRNSLCRMASCRLKVWRCCGPSWHLPISLTSSQKWCSKRWLFVVCLMRIDEALPTKTLTEKDLP